MSEKVQTEGEAKQPELDEAVADGTEKVEPELAVEKEEEVKKTDEEILDALQKRVIPEAGDIKKESRKTRAIKKSIKEYDDAIVGDDEIDFAVLAEKFQKNEKGLKSFAESHNYDYDELLSEVQTEINGVQNPYKQQLEELQEQVALAEREKEEQAFKDTLVSLIAENGETTLSDFNAKHGETFSLLVDGLLARGKTPSEAAKEAFGKINLSAETEKEELLKNSQAMPLGKEPEEKKVEEKLDSAINVNNPDLYTKEKRLAYKKKFRNPDGSVKYK